MKYVKAGHHQVRAVVFDCDGVLLESTDIKTEAFRALFAESHPGRVPEILSYHVRNMGISRHVKFRHICTEILGEPFTRRRAEELARRFSRLVYERVLACPAVPGAMDFLRRQSKRLDLFVASGTPQPELRRILKRRGMLRHFKKVWGSPSTKPEVIRAVLRSGPYRRREVVFVGDAESDWRAARQTGVSFVRRVGTPADWSLPACRWEIRDLRSLPARLAAIERAFRTAGAPGSA